MNIEDRSRIDLDFVLLGQILSHMHLILLFHATNLIEEARIVGEFLELL